MKFLIFIFAFVCLSPQTGAESENFATGLSPVVMKMLGDAAKKWEATKGARPAAFWARSYAF